MTEEEYKAAIEQYKAEHSAGGSLEHGEWKKHKYIRIENGRYIYPEDLKKSSSVGQKTPVAVGGRLTNPEYESHRDRVDSYQTTESYQTEAKKLAEARATGRKATQEYKSSGQYEKDLADEKAKVEKQKQAEANKKEFEESTKQLSPQEQYKKEQAEKSQQNTPEKKETTTTTQTVNIVDTKTANEARKAAREATQASKLESLIAETSSGKTEDPRSRVKSGKNTLEEIRQEIVQKSNAVKNEVYELSKKYPGSTVEATDLEPETGAPQRFEIRDKSGKLLYDTGNFLSDYDEWNYKRVKHSYNDPKSFYAAVYDYKQAHKR